MASAPAGSRNRFPAPQRGEGGRGANGRAAGLLALATGLALVLGACTGPPSAPGQPFRDARALAVTPDGTLWVVEGADGTVLAIRDGAVVQRLGGVGTGDQAFLDPVGVDPTNGQAIYVADRAAGLVVQFTAQGRRAGALVVPDLDGASARQPAGDFGRETTRGQPMAVAAASDGTVFVIDGGRGHVLRLSNEGTVERVLGAGTLGDPVALSLADDGTLWVADAGRGGVQPFDAFGSAGAFVPAPGLGRIVGVSVGRSGLLVVGTDAAVLTVGGEIVARTEAGALGTVRGAVVWRGRALLLSATAFDGPAASEVGRLATPLR
ncbi:hypothetical protein [Rubrivirga sp. IMCC43871]|uniref:hypothetical protein n=1 Tax=Rubrivirga sp. IMCC43871 TaxID=3391575 RepID=UPI0039900FD2